MGVLFPDFIDKPLGEINIVPAYHTVAHSLVTGSLIGIIAYMFGKKEGMLRSFAVGYLVHIAGDLLLTMGKWDKPEFFLWPLLRPNNPVSRPIKEYAIDYITSPWFIFELILAGLVLLSNLRRVIRR